MQPWEPQPYAAMNLDDVLVHITGAQQKTHVAACAFDRDHLHFYMFEPLADGDKCIVHVWSVTP